MDEKNQKKLEELQNLDLVSNVEADMNDLLTGRIKDVEHLQAVDTLLDLLCNIEETARDIASRDESATYSFINSHSMEQMEGVFKRLRAIDEELKDIFC